MLRQTAFVQEFHQPQPLKNASTRNTAMTASAISPIVTERKFIRRRVPVRARVLADQAQVFRSHAWLASSWVAGAADSDERVAFVVDFGGWATADGAAVAVLLEGLLS